MATLTENFDQSFGQGQEKYGRFFKLDGMYIIPSSTLDSSGYLPCKKHEQKSVQIPTYHDNLDRYKARGNFVVLGEYVAFVDNKGSLLIGAASEENLDTLKQDGFQQTWVSEEYGLAFGGARELSGTAIIIGPHENIVIDTVVQDFAEVLKLPHVYLPFVKRAAVGHFDPAQPDYTHKCVKGGFIEPDHGQHGLTYNVLLPT